MCQEKEAPLEIVLVKVTAIHQISVVVNSGGPQGGSMILHLQIGMQGIHMIREALAVHQNTTAQETLVTGGLGGETMMGGVVLPQDSGPHIETALGMMDPHSIGGRKHGCHCHRTMETAVIALQAG